MKHGLIHLLQFLLGVFLGLGADVGVVHCALQTAGTVFRGCISVMPFSIARRDRRGRGETERKGERKRGQLTHELCVRRGGARGFRRAFL